MTAHTSTRTADDIFTVERTETAGLPASITLTVTTPEHEAEMTMEPETALWLARKLWQASGLPMDHGLRFRGRPVSAAEDTP